MIAGADVVTAARGWVGTRWHHGQMLKGVGTDCIGLVAGVALELGIADARPQVRNPIYNGYGRSPDRKMLLRAVAEYLDEADEPMIGGVLLMRFAVDPQHVAIVSELAPMRIIHAYAQARKVVENIADATWHARIVGSYRYRGVM